MQVYIKLRMLNQKKSDLSVEKSMVMIAMQVAAYLKRPLDDVYNMPLAQLSLWLCHIMDEQEQFKRAYG